MSLYASLRSFLSVFISSLFYQFDKDKQEEELVLFPSDATNNGFFPLFSPKDVILDPIGVRFFQRKPTIKVYTFSAHDFGEKAQLELSIPMTADGFDATTFNVFLFHEKDWYATPGYGPHKRIFYRTFQRYAPGRARIFINTLGDSFHGDNFTRIKVFVFQQVFPVSHKGNMLNTLNYEVLMDQIESTPSAYQDG